MVQVVEVDLGVLQVLAGIVVCSTAVLLGDRPPAPDRHRQHRRFAVEILRIDIHFLDSALMRPTDPEVEDELEVISFTEDGRHLHLLLILRLWVVWIREADLSSIPKPELVEMRQVPPREMEVDRPG